MAHGRESLFTQFGRTLIPSWRTPLFDRALAVLAVLIAICAAVWAAKSATELLNIAIIGLILSNVVMSWLVFFLARENTALASSKNITESDAIRIATEFRNLAWRQCDYESAVATYVTRFISNKETQEDWNKLVGGLIGFVECVCDTAVQVITKKKGYTPDNASANIKTFTSAPDGTCELVYQVLKRSRTSNIDRDAADEETRKKEFRVHANRMYDFILENRKHVFVPNMSRYLEETDKVNLDRIQASAHPYKEPSKKALSFLNSGLVVPILGRDVTLKTLKMPDRIITYESDWSLLGTFCIDSKNVGFFDDEYDLHVMSQLASHAFSALRTYYLMIALRNSRAEGHVLNEQSHPVTSIEQVKAQPLLPSA
jgi:hypothetical protein